MSNDRDHIEYAQLTKLYDECLHYLKENHEDVQTNAEVDEPGYETIVEAPINGAQDLKPDTKIANNYAIKDNKANDNIRDKVENHLDHTKHLINYLNSPEATNETEFHAAVTEEVGLLNGHQNTQIVEIDDTAENINDIIYETLNPTVKLNYNKENNATVEHKNHLALVKYDESQILLYETFNPRVKILNDNIMEDNIEIVINNDKLEDNNNNDTSYDNESEEEPKDPKVITFIEGKKSIHEKPLVLKLENEVKSTESLSSLKSGRLRKLSQQLPKIIITSSSTSLNVTKNDRIKVEKKLVPPRVDKLPVYNITRTPQLPRTRKAYGEFPKRLVSKTGLENVALISNVPFEKIRLLNDTFHTLINLRWRWIVIGTVVVHFLIWLVFAMFWYIAALAHYDFEPDPPKRSCVTGGKDFVTIFLASVEAQTTIGFGDRTIDEECPEAIFLFIMQLILGTGLSGVLTCVVYAKLTRPEKLSRDGVGFSKKAVVSTRDGRLCLMLRAWDLNYDHIISSEFAAHFISTRKTKEGEIIRYYAQHLALQQRQFLLWPVTLVHVIDQNSPLYKYGPDVINQSSFEITVSLKGASASMGTFTQSQTSYLPKEIVWGHRFPPVVKYDCRKQKYVIDHKKLDVTEAVETPYCSAEELNKSVKQESTIPRPPIYPGSFSEKLSVFQMGRTSSFTKKNNQS